MVNRFVFRRTFTPISSSSPNSPRQVSLRMEQFRQSLSWPKICGDLQTTKSRFLSRLNSKPWPTCDNTRERFTKINTSQILTLFYDLCTGQELNLLGGLIAAVIVKQNLYQPVTLISFAKTGGVFVRWTAMTLHLFVFAPLISRLTLMTEDFQIRTTQTMSSFKLDSLPKFMARPVFLTAGASVLRRLDLKIPNGSEPNKNFSKLLQCISYVLIQTSLLAIIFLDLISNFL